MKTDQHVKIAVRASLAAHVRPKQPQKGNLVPLAQQRQVLPEDIAKLGDVALLLHQRDTVRNALAPGLRLFSPPLAG